MDKKIEILKKLKALADRGIGGEKENAELLLKKYMKKYNISEKELNKDEEKKVYITLKNEIELKLASQILYAFFNNSPLYKHKEKGKRAKYYTILTTSQEIEFRYMYSIYLESFKKQELIFYRAFISKNNIFPKDVNTDMNEVSDEEREEMIKASMMQNGIEITQIRKCIGG